MKANPKFLLGATLVSSATLFTPAALAEVELYNQDGTKLLLNADVVVAGFGNNNSWFGKSNTFLGDNTDSWWEMGFEPQLSFEAPVGGGTFFGKLSTVYTNTISDDASGLTIGEDDTHLFHVEQGHIGWKKNDLFSGLEDDTFSISTGRQDYTIGTGLLVADGGGLFAVAVRLYRRLTAAGG